MEFSIHNRVEVEPSFRTAQVAGMFDLSADHSAEFHLEGSIDLESEPWQIGLIVGPSGTGKTTLARELFGKELISGYSWPKTKSILDGFPKKLTGKDIVQTLSAVGFSSPPSWLKPFHCLSNGEQFRVTLARALASADFVVMDEFTSVVDRTVAQIGSAAVSKAIRRDPKRKFVAVSCHYDILDWLDPDWVFEPDTGHFFRRRERRRPELQLVITRAERSAWDWFRHHHYLDTSLVKAAQCFLGTIEDRPAAFTACLIAPHPKYPRGYWREHRTVCHPDFQGVGIGNAMSEFVASLFSWERPYHSTTSHPAMIRHRARSPKWKMIRKPGFTSPSGEKERCSKDMKRSYSRVTAGFRYVGEPADRDLCRQLVPNLFKPAT